VTIQELGSLGELIAAIATLATLVYLALQIRGSTAATRAEARRSMDADSHETIRRVACDPDIAQLFMTGLGKPDSLNPEQRFRFNLLLSHFFTLQATAWSEHRLGTMSKQELAQNLERSRPFLESPGGQAWWTQNSAIYPLEFREDFESWISRPSR
jgi:hypothetical protein